MKTHTLIVWEWLPENIQFFVIPNDEITDEQNNLLQQAHGYIINSTGDCNNDGLAFLCVALLRRTEETLADNANEKYVDHLGCFAKYLRYDGEQDSRAHVLETGEAITRVVRAGFAY